MGGFACLSRFWLLCLVVTFLNNSCLVSPLWADDRKMLWQSREQFVAIEPLEKNTDAPNTHPVEVAAENLTANMAALALRSEESAAAEPLFTQETLQTVVPYLQQALRTASSGDDVIFAVIGLHKSLYGLAKRPKVTTGRLFFRDKKLHMIIGLAQQDVNDRIDRRLEPFTPGSRQKAANGNWKIVPHDGFDLFQMKRKDWVVFNDVLKIIIAPQPPVAKSASTPAVVYASEPPRESPAEGKNLVERLKVLNELKNNGLITDAEYQDKRRQILNSL